MLCLEIHNATERTEKTDRIRQLWHHSASEMWAGVCPQSPLLAKEIVHVRRSEERKNWLRDIVHLCGVGERGPALQVLHAQNQRSPRSEVDKETAEQAFPQS
jgi:hypothetical protein